MKKVLFTFVLMLTAFSAKAMSYQQARDQALFLTDKMAYELDLTEEQYEAAFEVNLDYLMSVNTVDDVYSVYWKRRNLDLSYILFDWQYRTFCGLEYFYRPLYWGDGFWHFRIYAYYPHRHYYYYGYPGCYYSYRGAHSWHANGGRSYYHRHHFTTHDYGMRGGWDRGGYRNMNQGWRHNDGGNRGYDPHSPAHNNRPGNNRPGNGSHGNSRPDNGSHSNIGGSGSSSHGSVGGSRTNGGNPRLGHSTVTSDRNDRNHRYGSASSSGSGYGNRRQDGSSSFSNGDTPRSSTRETARGHRTDGGTSYIPSRSFSGSNASSSYRNSSNGRGYNSGRSVGSSSSSRSSYSGGSSSSRSSYSGGSSSSRSVGHSSGSSSHSGGGGGHFGGGRR